LKKADLILTDISYILTMDENFTEYKNADIVIKDEKIIDIGENKKNEYFGKTIVCKDKIAIPGLINTHTHAAMTLLRGYGSDNPLKVWLEEYIWPAEGKFVSYEFVKDGSSIACYEMLRNGITTFVDMYFFEDAVAESIKTAKIRGVLCTGILDFPTPGAKSPDEGLKKTEDFIKQFEKDEYVYPCVGPHAPYTCSPNTLKKAMDLAEKYDVLFHIHVSETKHEVNEIKEKYGETPVKHLDKIGVLNDRVLTAHMVYPTEEEIEILAKRGVKVAHCPESNLKLASGIAPIPKMLEAGITIGIGTDGTASNDDLDLIGEIATCAKLHKGVNLDPTVVNARQALAMATIGGAKSIRLEDKLGSLETGKLADIILIDINDPHLQPIFDPYTHIVYSSTGKDVDTVIVNGNIVVSEKKVLTLCKDELVEKAKNWGEKIKKEVKR